MEIRYTFTFEDYVAFATHSARKVQAGWVTYLIEWFLPPLVAAIGAVELARFNDPKLNYYATGLAIVAVAYAAVYPFARRRVLEGGVRAYLERMDIGGVTGEARLILTDDRLVFVTEADRYEARWQNMKGVEDVGHATYIYVTGVSAAIIPRAGCASDEEYEAARDFALRKLADRVIG
ncbi:MAG: hypothetical protein C0501_02740 [Isosphaera sp.]|nr:hypothetical protein [Isosphaera sp.]